MFASRYWPDRYFNPRYWPAVGASAVVFRATALPVNTTIYNYRQMVERRDPKRLTRPVVVYEFAGQRNFEE